MKLTENKLRAIIKEELKKLIEMDLHTFTTRIGPEDINQAAYEASKRYTELFGDESKKEIVQDISSKLNSNVILKPYQIEEQLRYVFEEDPDTVSQIIHRLKELVPNVKRSSGFGF